MKFTQFVFLFLISLFLGFSACTPKTTEKVTTNTREPVTVPKDVKPIADLSPCPKFKESSDPDAATTAHVLYRDLVKRNEFVAAFPLWKKAYTMAPAADGQRDLHYTDGAKIYYDKFTKTTDATQKKIYFDTIQLLYSQAAECYPKKAMTYKGLLAFDMYYKFSEYTTKEATYNLFKEVIDNNGEKSADYVVNPFTALLLEQYVAKKISVDEAKTYTKKLNKIIDYGNAKCKGKACDRWAIVNSYAPIRLEEFEGVKGFYDCAYYSEKYLTEFNAGTEDCDVITTALSRLKWGDCPADNPDLVAVYNKYRNKCYVAPTPSGPVEPSCRSFLVEGNYREAYNCYEEKGNESNNAKYLLTAAKINYANLKNFPEARKLARKALTIDPGMGAAHILIGKLYASSGPLCGSGTGFKSQVVVWVAIDEWQQAKKVDGSVTSEANNLINKYSKYMPDKESIFFQNLKEGKSYRVPCWIQQNTTIRTSD